MILCPIQNCTLADHRKVILLQFYYSVSLFTECSVNKSEVRLPEPVFLNVYGAPELIPRNEFRQPM